ncbi:MAG: hypothetical protein WC758_06750 [Candidatus Woesearchaeota archaeon]|jgi:hypothetical protein
MGKIFGKKGQAALEFLTTYGWAFMVILVMIGALAYFGVLNPQNMVPDSCSITAGLTCVDAQVNTSDASFSFINNMGEAITVTNLVINRGGTEIFNGDPDAVCTFNVGSVGYDTVTGIGDGETFSIAACPYDAVGLGKKTGQKAKLSFTLTYAKMVDGAYSHDATGTLTATVR